MANAPRDNNFVPTLNVPSSISATTILQPTSTPIAGVNPLNVAIVDGSGTQITSFGGGTQYTDAGAAAAHPIGTGLIFNNGGTYNFVSAAQPLPITGSLSIGGTTDNSAFTAGTTTGTPAMGFYHSTIDAVTDGRAAALAIDSKRNLFTAIRDAAGNARGLNIDANGALAATVTNATAGNLNATVVGTGTFVVQATLAAETSKIIGGVKLYDSVGTNVALIGSSGQLSVQQLSATGYTPADGQANSLSVPYDLTNGNVLNSISFPDIFNGTTWDRRRSIINATNSVGTGIAAAGIVAQFDDVAPTAISENQFGNSRMSANRNLYVTLRDAAGNERGLNIDANNALATTTTLAAETTKVIGVTRTADGAGNLLTTNSTTYTAKFGLDGNLLGTLGTAFSTAGKIDVKGADGDVFVRQTTSSNLNADVNLKSIAGTGIVTGGVAGSQSVGGTVATNVAITANPLNLGAQAVSSENTAVTTARQVQLVADLVGKLIVLPYANPENFVSARATATDTTSTSLLGAPAAGLRNYITQISVLNTSATTIYVKIQDGSGGTELYDIPAPAGSGSTLTFPTPLRQPTTATAIFFAESATASAVFISASGYKGA